MKKKLSKFAKFTEGETVKVCPKEHIMDSLDSLSRRDGCLFIEQMSDYCEKKYRILKVVYNYFDEYERRMYKSKVPLYLLENLICNGVVDSFKYKCDHSCFLLWHEEWFEKNTNDG